VPAQPRRTPVIGAHVPIDAVLRPAGFTYPVHTEVAYRTRASVVTRHRDRRMGAYPSQTQIVGADVAVLGTVGPIEFVGVSALPVEAIVVGAFLGIRQAVFVVATGRVGALAVGTDIVRTRLPVVRAGQLVVDIVTLSVGTGVVRADVAIVTTSRPARVALLVRAVVADRAPIPVAA